MNFTNALIAVAAFAALWMAPFLSPLWDTAAARTAPLKERSARAWADLKHGLSKKATAGADLVALLWPLMVGAAVFLTLAPVVFLSLAVGYLVSPLGLVKEVFWEPLRIGFLHGEEATTDFCHRALTDFGRAVRAE